jgi:guanidinoacetate N-methyltransferase
MIRDILSKTGWTENEIAIYSTLLEKGAMDLTNISSEASIGKSTLQYTLKQLSMKKMISKSRLNNKPIYSVSDLGQLKKWVRAFVKQFQQYQESMESFIAQYDFNPKAFTPKLRMYEGHKGVRQSYRDILESFEGEEIVAIFSVVEEVAKDLQDFFVHEYVPERVKRGIKMRNIALDSPKSLAYQARDTEELRQTLLVSPEFFPVINTEINIFNDMVHFMSFDSKSAFAAIIQDKNLSAILKAIFNLLWKQNDLLYMTDNPHFLHETRANRQGLYLKDLKKTWKNSKPQKTTTAEGEVILEVLGHEVMSTYQLPYMKKLADIVTQNGGDILNVGYGLGIIDREIEAYRKTRKLGVHTVIEINKHLVREAEKIPNLKLIESDWHDALESFHGEQFDGIVYDGYPLIPEELHRDGILFIEKVVQRNLLKKNGVLTFYVDAKDSFGKEFTSFLEHLGFEYIQTEKVPIIAPKRNRQIWKQDHFLAPTLKYKAKDPKF